MGKFLLVEILNLSFTGRRYHWRFPRHQTIICLMLYFYLKAMERQCWRGWLVILTICLSR